MNTDMKKCKRGPTSPRAFPRRRRRRRGSRRGSGLPACGWGRGRGRGRRSCSPTGRQTWSSRDGAPATDARGTRGPAGRADRNARTPGPAFGPTWTAGRPWTGSTGSTAPRSFARAPAGGRASAGSRTNTLERKGVRSGRVGSG